MAFKYTADYYDPSQPTEEEGAKEPGENRLKMAGSGCVCLCL